MIRWILTFFLGLLWDELRAQLLPFLDPFAVIDQEMREAAGGVGW